MVGGGIMEYTVTIKLNPVTKKNHSQIIMTGSKPRLIPSKQYNQYLKDCGYFIKRLSEPLKYQVNVKALYYMETRRRTDLINLHAALHDILVHYGILLDDNSGIIVSTDGSRVLYDKNNPRTEIYIEKVS